MTTGFDWGVPLVYAGLCAGFVGAVSLGKPLRFLGIPTRRAGAAVFAAGLIAVAAGVLAPAPLVIARGERSRLDDFVPSFQFHESHGIRVHAPAPAVFRAVRGVTAREVRFFRALTWIRSPRLPGAGRRDILAPPPDLPLLDVALHSGFLLLDEVPDREIVFGTVLCGRLPGAGDRSPRAFAAFSRPGFCKVAMNFRIAEEDGGFVRLTTETRVLALGASARRRFAAYWRVISPGSSFIRRMWLEAIRRRAEGQRSACREELEPFTRPVDEALARFDPDTPGRGERAEALLAQARLLREKLEGAAIEPVCETPKRETLLFLNHVVLGFQAYVDGGSRDGTARDELDGIVRRARAHERRGITGR